MENMNKKGRRFYKAYRDKIVSVPYREKEKKEQEQRAGF